jgi:hypothetical protein
LGNINMIDMLFLEDLLDMGGGYVMNFSNRTFSQFFEELGIDIYAEDYSRNGTSKANHLRCFLQSADKPAIARALSALWNYREAVRRRSSQGENIVNASGQLSELVCRIQGISPAATPAPTVTPVTSLAAKLAANHALLANFMEELQAMFSMASQARGYAYEKFLKRLFDAYGLDAREAFRLRGEQIDGSFQFEQQTYLLEAKWQGAQTGAADLRNFQGKLNEKAAWTRGLFVSDSGFTPDGLAAFGRGKSLICMSGLDIYDMLDREIPLPQVLLRKARHMAETGSPFVQVRDLFP